MCQYLPTGEFRFLPTWDLQQILQTAPDADYGCFLEVDLHYPPHLHEKLNDYPPAPTKTKPSILSPFQREMIRQNLRAKHIKDEKWTEERIEKEVDKTTLNEKLIASLEDKKNYVCHYRLLQKYVELGMEVIFNSYAKVTTSKTLCLSLGEGYNLNDFSLDNERSSRRTVSSKTLDEGIYRIQHSTTNTSYIRFRKRFLQVNE